MVQKKALVVDETIISVVDLRQSGHLSLSDMEKDAFTVTRWLGQTSTLVLLGIWEQLYNPYFLDEAFEELVQESARPDFTITVKTWIEKTAATGLCIRTGRYAGAYAHRDIAVEFAGWISPMFKLRLVKTLQDSGGQHSEWSFRRALAATNYKIHSAAVKSRFSGEEEKAAYSEEAELINLALFGQGSREWKEKHPALASGNKTIRDYADTHQLIVLSNLESINAVLLQKGLSKEDRYEMMRDAAVAQMSALQRGTGAIVSPLRIV